MSETKPERTLGQVLILVAVLLPSWPWNAWVLAKMWLWFLVPLGVPAVGMAHAYGVWLLLGFMWFRTADVREKATDVELLTKAYGAPLVALGMGALMRWIAF